VTSPNPRLLPRPGLDSLPSGCTRPAGAAQIREADNGQAKGIKTRNEDRGEEAERRQGGGAILGAQDG